MPNRPLPPPNLLAIRVHLNVHHHLSRAFSTDVYKLAYVQIVRYIRKILQMLIRT